jgi:8-oxo-dGTP pyrophosphatase MutT (NUDIX family)
MVGLPVICPDVQIYLTFVHSFIRMNTIKPHTSLIEASAALQQAFPLVTEHPVPVVSDKHAAVLCVLFEKDDGDICAWLTKRSSTMRSHAGEVSFPGGKRDEADATAGDIDVNTSLREAQEEIGLDPQTVKILAKTSPRLSKHRLSVTCVIATTTRPFKPLLNPDEVELAFSAPLSAFVHPQQGIHSHKDIEWERFRYRLHFFELQGHLVWGLTAHFLIQVAKAAFQCKPSFQEEGPRTVDYSLIYNDPINGLALRTAAAPPQPAAAGNRQLATTSQDKEEPSKPAADADVKTR